MTYRLDVRKDLIILKHDQFNRYFEIKDKSVYEIKFDGLSSRKSIKVSDIPSKTIDELSLYLISEYNIDKELIESK